MSKRAVGVIKPYSFRQAVPEILQQESDQDVVMGLAPFFHSMGFMVMMLNLLGGKKFIIQGKFHPRRFLENIVKYKVEHLFVLR